MGSRAIQRDMERAIEACNKSNAERELAFHEFVVACQLGDFERAQESALKAQAQYEANMDAFLRFHRFQRQLEG